MLVREIWKFIHPRVSYSLRATPEGNMIFVGEYIFIFPEPACYKCFIIPNEIKKTHTCKLLLTNILSPLERYLRHLKTTSIATVACKWCVPSASDVFLSKNDNSGGKTREASEGVEYDFYFTEYDFCPVWSRVLICTHCPIKLIYEV
jgi:hypothetical protein